MFFSKNPKKKVEDMTDIEFSEYIHRETKITIYINVVAIVISVIVLSLQLFLSARQ